MSHAYAARGTRQTAVLAAIVGLHFAVFLVIALGLHPRPFEVLIESGPITQLPPEKPVPVVERPDGNFDPGEVVIVVSEPYIDPQQFDDEPVVITAPPAAGAGPAGETGSAGRVVEVVPPKLRTRPANLSALIDSCYPAGSRRLNEEGKVLAQVTIGAQGSAVNWRVTGSSGFARLDAATACVVRKLDFVAGRRDGQAVEAEVLLPIVFRLR